MQGTLYCYIVIYSTFYRGFSGIFNQIEAAKAYGNAAIKYHGRYANVNFPPNNKSSLNT